MNDKGEQYEVRGLLAAGEAACASVHGANRLGANSLLDLVVFGRRAAETTKEEMTPGAKQPDLKPDAGEATIARLDKTRYSKGQYKTGEIRTKMQKIMQTKAAVYRTQKTLEEGCQQIKEIGEMHLELGISDRGNIWNTDLVEAMELENLIQSAKCTVYSAENRKESRGGHARDDFTARDDENWLKHTMAFCPTPQSTPTFQYKPVIFETLDD